MTNAEFVSKVVNALRLLNVDQHISRRFVLRTGRDVSKWIITQKLLDRSLGSETKLYTKIDCFELKVDDVVRCPMIEFRRCKKLMRSKNPLPELIFSRLGSSIKQVTAIDDYTEITVLDASQYRRNQQRQYGIKHRVYAYLGVDNHLYIPDEDVRTINLQVLTMETDLVEQCSSCIKSSCKSGWEYEFICPDRLEKTVFDETLKTLLGTYKAVQVDQNPNSIEGA